MEVTIALTPGRIVVVTVLLLLITHRIGWAQSATTGAIAGTVRDATGAVLPGVSIEAASPALIEKVRAVITDDQLGQQEEI